MKEAVVLSLIFAVLCFGQSDVNTAPPPATSGYSTNKVPTTQKPTSALTTEMISSTGLTSTGLTDQTSTHSATTSVANSTTISPKTKDVYAVLDKRNNTYCILIKANISITFNYMNTSDHKPASGVVTVPPPDGVSVSGSCNEDGGKQQQILISFRSGWNLTLTFEKPNGKYFQSNISLDWDLGTSDLKNAPNITGQILNSTHLFETSTGYLCMARKTLYSDAATVNNVSGIYTEKLQLEAFQQKHDTKFADKYERCSEDSISNLVPIIVGACLGGLIIIVLIAYLIGRKRSRRGYESV